MFVTIGTFSTENFIKYFFLFYKKMVDTFYPVIMFT